MTKIATVRSRSQHHRGLHNVLIVAFVVVLCGAGLMIETRAASQEFASENKLYADYVDATNLIREKHVDPPEYDALNRAGIQGMLRTLDPHSVYYDRKGFEELRREQRSVYYGIGASIQGCLHHGAVQGHSRISCRAALR